MTVYVRWYDKVLEGELLEGETMGMKQVRIPIDGHHPVALFTPEHVYDSADKISEKPHEISRSDSFTCHQEPDMSLLRFKEEHWDHERNHLRTDYLNQFYQLWRDNMAMRMGTGRHQPSMKIEAPATPDEAVLPQKPQRIVSDERMAELRTQLKKSLKPVEATQLSLFD